MSLLLLFYPSPSGAVSPTVTTDSVINIQTTSATGNGTVTSAGGGTISERGFVISTSPAPTILDTKFIASGVTEGAFSVGLTGLVANTTYYVRAYVTTEWGTVYGAETNFSTSALVNIHKHYIYKVYDSESGALVDIWADEVISDPVYKSVINGGSGELRIKLARPFDEFGEDEDVKLNNKVKVFCFDKEAPNGQVIFYGYISGYKPIIKKASEYIEITLFDFTAELQRIVLRDGSGNTTIAYNSYDPSNILKDVIDKYRTLGGNIGYSGSSIELTGTTVSYTFNTNTIKECLDKIIELCPIGWYYRVDPDGYIYLASKPTVATHVFTIGLDVEELETFRRVEDLINRVLFTGGGDPPLFIVREDTTSQGTYGLYEVRVVDERVTVTATAQTIAQRLIDQFKEPEIRSTFLIVDSAGPNDALGYDIESIKPGQTLKVENLKTTTRTPTLWDVAQWDVDVWDQTLSLSAADIIQILSVSYDPDSITIEASSRLPQVAKRIEDINRNLQNSQTANNPVAPS